MKKLSICLIAVLGVLCGAIASWGSIYTPPTYPENLLVVVEDTNGGNNVIENVTFSITNFTFPTTLYQVGQILGDGSFQAFTPQTSGPVGLTSATFLGGTIVDFAISDGSLLGTYSLGEKEGTVYFPISKISGTPDAPLWASEWYGSASILWNTPSGQYNFDIISSNNPGSGLAPVPIPATALLFCSSILGIVGIRRKISK